MSEKDQKKLMAVLKKQQEDVSTSRVAARRLLLELGLITPSGRLSKSTKPLKFAK